MSRREPSNQSNKTVPNSGSSNKKRYGRLKLSLDDIYFRKKALATIRKLGIRGLSSDVYCSLTQTQQRRNSSTNAAQNSRLQFAENRTSCSGRVLLCFVFCFFSPPYKKIVCGIEDRDVSWKGINPIRADAAATTKKNCLLRVRRRTRARSATGTSSVGSRLTRAFQHRFYNDSSSRNSSPYQNLPTNRRVSTSPPKVYREKEHKTRNQAYEKSIPTPLLACSSGRNRSPYQNLPNRLSTKVSYLVAFSTSGEISPKSEKLKKSKIK
jgi:hypothetical protein